MRDSLGVRKTFFPAKIVFAISVDIIGLKKYQLNTEIFLIFHPILMNKGSFDS